jgi:hypothetical protein
VRGAAEKEIGAKGRSSCSASSGGGVAQVGKGGGAVREVQGRVPPFYSPERSRGRGMEAVGGEVGGRSPLMAMSSVGWGGGVVSGWGKVRRRHVWAAAH